MLADAGASEVGASESCPQLSAEDARNIARYVHDQFQFADATTLEISQVEAVKDTCFKKIHVRQKNSTGRNDHVFFLSPDNKFLSRDLFDTTTPISPMMNSMRNINARNINMDELLGGRFPSKGGSNAPVTIVIFADFECPYCGQAGKILSKEIALNQSGVRLIFRHLPLPMHPWARTAAEMAECTFAQSNEAFWELHDFLLANQSALNVSNLDARVIEVLDKRSDIDVTTYLSCVAEHKMAVEIERDLLFAQEHQIDGTPTLFVNGVRKQGLSDIREFRDLLGYQTAVEEKSH